MDLKHLSENGYIVIPNLVPTTFLNGVVEDILGVLDVPYAVDQMGMLELYHTQAMWDIRQYKPLYEVYSDIFKNKKLWVSIDRVNYKKPVAKNLRYINFDDGFIHWDVCVNRLPKLKEFQGVLALTDTDISMGGFQCAPSLYQELEEWIESLPTRKVVYSHFNIVGEDAVEFIPSSFPRREPKSWKIEKIPVKAGDFIIWDSLLPHGNSGNMGDECRFAQYITMSDKIDDDVLRKERINCWLEDRPPSGYSFPGNPNIKKQTQPAKLSLLGKRLLGVSQWKK